MRILGVIPARYHSQRLPGKVLLPLKGKPIIQHVYERVRQFFGENLIVATDDMRVVEAVEGFGGKAIMTRTTHSSGTERVSEVAEKLVYDAYINVQADEPFLEVEHLQLVARGLEKHEIVTLATRIYTLEEVLSPSVVKVVLDAKGRALYFSRSLVPHVRDMPINNPEMLRRYPFYRHVGLYGYRRETLMAIVSLSTAPIEEAEQLEQLRWLYHGYSIHVLETTRPTFSIDTDEEYAQAQKLAERLL
jgi:3-deoxy-manno-octulosonate cytidylyltransferase (CMP-KDO synthetase)